MLDEATRREHVDTTLLRRYHDDDDLAARDELAERCAPLVRSIARRYAGRGEPFDDLLQAGMLGLVKAIDRFDPSAGHRFVSFAVPTIQGEIRRHFRDHTWAVHVPRSMQELDARIQAARAAVLADTGREPTEDDLAAELQIGVQDVRDARGAGRAYRTMSLDAPAAPDHVVRDTHGACDPGYGRVEDTCVVEDALEALDDRQRRVIAMRYQDDLLQREIAEQIGVSQMQVSRIIAGAVRRMSEHVDGGDAALAA